VAVDGALSSGHPFGKKLDREVLRKIMAAAGATITQRFGENDGGGAVLPCCPLVLCGGVWLTGA